MGYKASALRTSVEEVLGKTYTWEKTPRGWRFRMYADTPLALPLLNKLAAAIGTDAINFNCGESGWGGTDVTPGEPGSPGYIEIIGDFE